MNEACARCQNCPSVDVSNVLAENFELKKKILSMNLWLRSMPVDWTNDEAEVIEQDPQDTLNQDIELVTPSRDEEELIIRRESFIEESTVFVKEEYEIVDVKLECTETGMNDSFLTEYEAEQEKDAVRPVVKSSLVKEKKRKHFCEECNYSSARPSDLRIHIESKHQGVRYPCGECEYAATEPRQLKRHREAKHEGISFVCVSLGSNILVFHNLGTRSHLNIVYPIIRQLLDNGDQVHSMIYSPAGFLHENYTELLLEDHYGLMMERVSQEYGSGGRTFLDPSHLLYMLTEWSNIIYEGTKALDTPQFKKLSNSTFDLVLSFNPWGFYLGELFDCPVVVSSPPGAFPSHTQLIGNPFNPSYQPVITSDLSDPTRFLSRVKNYLMYHVMDLIFRRFADTAITYSMRNQIEYEGPSMFQLAEKRLALVLSNSNFITHTAQPLLPNVVEVGGVHIKDVVEDLPEDIQKFLDAATDGVVYVSFGSAIRTNRIPEKKVQILLDSFKAVGVPVLLKWDTNITTTNNIMVKQWLPQQAVLQHPNVKVFLTHGGLMSVMESLHTKTVMVGVPMATDQFANIARAVNNNIAKHVSWETLTADQLTQAMKSALTDKNMQRSIRKLGDLFGDAPESALQRAVWWINYVIRHNGAKFLRSESLRLDWYQVYLLDVMFVLFILPAISILSLGRWLLASATTYKEKRD